MIKSVNPEVVIIAPFPGKEMVSEGWMSRINSIDLVIKDRRRLYINLAQHHAAVNGNLTQVEERAWEIYLSPFNFDHQGIIDQAVEVSKIVYVHTIHLAEHIQAWLGSMKIVVDFHGIVPEEEAMLGRPELSEKYERIEQKVLASARACVMVTRSMEKHYREKYPSIRPRTIILPIVEAFPRAAGVSDKSSSTELPVHAVYAGGTQIWQNISSMLELAETTREVAKFTFLSHDWKTIEELARRTSFCLESHFGFCPKSDLAAEYRRHDFGLILRDDTAVNRVACPTKLFEYMSSGVVPIVRSPALGDFLELNYAFISEDEFKEGFFPDSRSRKMMALKNFLAVDTMIERFSLGEKQLRELLE